MALEIATFYAGFGIPHYRENIGFLVETARRYHEGATLTHITDRGTPKLEGFDRVWRSPEDIGWNQIGTAKGQLISQVALQTEFSRTVFVDPDVMFNRNIEEGWGDWDVGLSFRRSSPHKVFNTGLILSTKRGAPLWNAHNDMSNRICRDVHSWWADQLSFGCLLGINHQPGDILEFEGCRVGLLDFATYSPKPDALPVRLMDSYTTHFTGDHRKIWMRPYADIGRI